MNNVLDGAELLSAENAKIENETQEPLGEEAISDPTGFNDATDGNGYTEGEGDNDTPASLDEGFVDYGAIMESDVAALRAEFPELSGITNVTELDNPLRYAALRDLGLSPREAYLATEKRVAKDTRAHLRSAHGRGAAPSESTMTHRELAMARELFPGKNDAELHSLYKRVRN